MFLFHMLSLDFFLGGGLVGGDDYKFEMYMYKIKLYKIIVQLIRVDDSWNGCCIQDIEKIETLAHV